MASVHIKHIYRLSDFLGWGNYHHEGRNGEAEASQGGFRVPQGTGGKNRSHINFNSCCILNIIILSPWCQWIQGIHNDWSTVSALQVCQERQESVKQSCAVCQRDTSSSFPKEVNYLGSCLLLYHLCQQLIHDRAQPTQKSLWLAGSWLEKWC